MNKIFGKIAMCLALAAPCVGFYSCSEPDDEITSLEFDRLFRPTEFKTSGATEASVEFAWDCISHADSYVIEIFAGDEELLTAQNESAVPTMTFTAIKSPYVAEGLEEQTVYSARIKAVSENGKESKWALVEKSFKTKKAAEPEPPAPVEQSAHLEFAVGAVADSYTCGCIEMKINNGNGKFAIDANTQYFGDTNAQTKYTARLKSGGNSSSSNGVSLVCAGSGKVVLAMRSSSSSADRNVTITKGGAEVAKFVVGDANADKGVAVPGEAEPKTVFHTYSFDFTPGTYEIAYDGGLNFYGVDATYVVSDQPGSDPEPVGPTGTAGEIAFANAAATVADGQTFAGGSLTIAINNGNGKYAIDDNKQYFGDASAQTQYVKRLKSGGNSSSTNGMTLTVSAKGTVTIAMRSSSSSAARKVEILDAAGAVVQTWTVDDTNCTKDVTIAGEDAAKTVFKYYTVTLEEGTYSLSYDGGTNFYSFIYAPAK